MALILHLKLYIYRNHAVQPLQQLLLTLRYFATANFYITVADFGGLHKSTVGKIIPRVVYALTRLRHQYIAMPQTREEKEATAVEFHRVARFPRVVGAIDCTHVRLQSPGKYGNKFRTDMCIQQ